MGRIELTRCTNILASQCGQVKSEKPSWSSSRIHEGDEHCVSLLGHSIPEAADRGDL
jgi:hypothetical protein